MEFRVGGVGVLQFRFLLELIYRHIEFIGSRVSGKDHGAQGQWRAVLWDHPNDKNRDHDLNKQTRSSTSRSGGIAASMGVYRGQGYRFGIISAIQGPQQFERNTSEDSCSGILFGSSRGSGGAREHTCIQRDFPKQ